MFVNKSKCTNGIRPCIRQIRVFVYGGLVKARSRKHTVENVLSVKHDKVKNVPRKTSKTLVVYTVQDIHV